MYKRQVYKNCSEAKVLGTSPPGGCEFMHEPDFLVLNCMVVPKEKFIQRAEENIGGAI